MQSANVAEALDRARRRIELAEARVLLQCVLGCSHATLATHPERVLAPDELARFVGLVEGRVSGRPVAYLIGCREFYGREFRVGPEVLIPRPETELLVDLALERMRPGVRLRILDLGTGSGVLAITLSLERPGVEVTAVERSDAALATARLNGRALGAPVRFLQGDWFGPVRGERFDLVVANPPYVAPRDPHLAEGDLRHEPVAALSDGSPDGLGSIRTIVSGSRTYLRPSGWLLFEHGHDQAAHCRGFLEEEGFIDVSSWRDLAGIERVSGGRDTH